MKVKWRREPVMKGKVIHPPDDLLLLLLLWSSAIFTFTLLWWFSSTLSSPGKYYKFFDREREREMGVILGMQHPRLSSNALTWKSTSESIWKLEVRFKSTLMDNSHRWEDSVPYSECPFFVLFCFGRTPRSGCRIMIKRYREASWYHSSLSGTFVVVQIRVTHIVLPNISLYLSSCQSIYYVCR